MFDLNDFYKNKKAIFLELVQLALDILPEKDI